MSAPAPFFLVTDDAREAALTLFAREPEFVPAFVTVVTELGQLVAIPTGARAVALWFHKEGVFRQVWREQIRHRLDCGRGWSIFDEVAAWRAEIWQAQDGDLVASPSQPGSKPAPAAPVAVSSSRKPRWS